MAEFAATARSIEEHFRAMYTATPVEWENAAPFKSSGARFVRFVVKEAGRKQVALPGPRDTRIVGVVMAQILVPRNEGTRTARDIADAIAGIFDGQMVGEAQFRRAEAVPIGPTDEWWQMNVSVPFFVTEGG